MAGLRPTAAASHRKYDSCAAVFFVLFPEEQKAIDLIPSPDLICLLATGE
jgi:hypothetical protein